MPYTVTFIIAILCAFSGHSQTLIVHGTIQDEQKDEALPFATIISPKTTYSDFDGQFITEIDRDSALFGIFLPGFDTAQIDLSQHIGAADSIELIVFLYSDDAKDDTHIDFELIQPKNALIVTGPNISREQIEKMAKKSKGRGSERYLRRRKYERLQRKVARKQKRTMGRLGRTI